MNRESRSTVKISTYIYFLILSIRKPKDLENKYFSRTFLDKIKTVKLKTMKLAYCAKHRLTRYLVTIMGTVCQTHLSLLMCLFPKDHWNSRWTYPVLPLAATTACFVPARVCCWESKWLYRKCTLTSADVTPSYKGNRVRMGTMPLFPFSIFFSNCRLACFQWVYAYESFIIELTFVFSLGNVFSSKKTHFCINLVCYRNGYYVNKAFKWRHLTIGDSNNINNGKPYGALFLLVIYSNIPVSSLLPDMCS